MTEPTDFVYQVLVVHRAPSPGDDYLWVNRHQITADAGLLGDETRLNAVAGAFATFHAAVLFETCVVDRVVISTYGPDLPWPPGFASYPANLPGVVGIGSWGEPLPLEVVAFVRRNVTRGRDGKFFLRGALSRTRVDRFGNIDQQTRDLINSRAATLLAALSNQDVQLVMASGPVAAIQTRQVQSLQVVNARTLQFRARRKSAIRRYQLTQTLLGEITDAQDLAQVWSLLNQLGVTQSPLLPPPGQ